MVNITQLIPEFKAADMAAYIQQYNMGDLFYTNYFPTSFTPELTFKALQAQYGAKVAADVVAFDSRAPRKGRPLPGNVLGDIPKVEIARSKKETDLNTYRQLLALSQQVTDDSARRQANNALVDWMYEDTKFCLDGVNARMEWLAKQIASNGKFSLTTANNEAGIQTKVDVDFGIPNGNRQDAIADWSNPANAKPISDFTAIDKVARAKGFKLGYALMAKETFDQFAASEEVQKASATFANLALSNFATPSLETVNLVLRNRNLPQIQIWDSYVTIENKKGEQSAVSGWVEGNVTFSVGPQLGATKYTTTADGFVNIDQSTKSTNGIVLVKTWADQDPITMTTKGVAYAVPVLSGVNQTYILKTKLS